MQSEKLNLTGIYTVECYGADGTLKWKEDFPNLVTTVGKNFVLNSFFDNTLTSSWYMGLVTGPGASNTYSASDTMAVHPGWVENTAYSNANRLLMSWNPASGAVKVANSVSFSINGSATIAGAFVVTNNTKGGTTGTLYSVGNFTAGDRGVISGDTLNVTYTASA